MDALANVQAAFASVISAICAVIAVFDADLAEKIANKFVTAA